MSLLYKTVMQSQRFTFSCCSFETQHKQPCLHWKTSVYTFSRSSWSLCSLDSKHTVILFNQWVIYGHIFEKLKTKSEALLHSITSVPSLVLHIIYQCSHPIIVIWQVSKHSVCSICCVRGLHSCRQVSVPMLSSVHHTKTLWMIGVIQGKQPTHLQGKEGRKM